MRVSRPYRFSARLPLLFQPLAGSSRFFRDVTGGLDRAQIWRQFVALLFAAAVVMVGFDAIGRLLTADVRAAVGRIAPTPYAEPLLPSPWSELASGGAVALIWLIYVAYVAAIRSFAARFFSPGLASSTFATQLSYAAFGAVPLIVGAVFSKGISLLTLPTDPADLNVPAPATLWLPVIIFAITLFAESWIISRALILRHEANTSQAFFIWFAPILFLAGLFAAYLFGIAVYNASAY